jgi:hypothetical protein
MALVGASGIFLYLTNSEPSKNSQTESRGAPPLNYTQQLKQCLPKIGLVPSAFNLKQKPGNLRQTARREKDEQNAVRENRNGRTYIPISIFELYELCETGSIENFKKDGFVLRGVFFNDDISGKIQPRLFRATQWCCPGHEVAWGFRLRGGVSVTINDGKWVKAYIRMQGLTVSDPKVKVTTPVAPTSMLRNDYELIVDHIAATSIPEKIYTTNWSNDEPFHY